MYNETQCGSCEYHDGIFLCSGCPAVPTHREHPESVRCMWYTSRSHDVDEHGTDGCDCGMGDGSMPELHAEDCAISGY